ncbi:hypothetical protein BegalDRAFT_0963 [Beggiatoa alba B18LD]|uniref:Uncharacterized protein n=1 Tax=Beggiatoa alba B18LD TaxID=395493 RepID=I3CE25_9GAMM|nr:hypothetical protein [Beggiatoa alba]EIJ41868.1 hypothetical protein BegalDRAFT_0963 [Beggiatoa alba B18LD]
MYATAKKNVRIPVDRIDEVLEYLSLVAPEQDEEVLNIVTVP